MAPASRPHVHEEERNLEVRPSMGAAEECKARQETELFRQVVRHKSSGEGVATLPQPCGQHARRQRLTEQKEMTMRKAASAKNTGAAPQKSVLKDFKGGLTAAGRAEFRKREGAHLNPDFKKSVDDMSADEMLRKGSWAVRSHGRAGALPPLIGPDGKFTRSALTALGAKRYRPPFPLPAALRRSGRACLHDRPVSGRTA